MEKATHGVDSRWKAAFVLEARLLDLPGDRIGDALAVVEEHLAESGQPVSHAFGDPVEYARSLAREQPPAEAPGALGPRHVVGAVTGVVGLALTPAATTSVLSGEASVLTLGQLLTLAIAAAVMLAVAARPDPMLRRLTGGGRWAWTAVVATVPVLLFVALMLLLQQPVLTVPAPAVAVGAGVLLVLGTWSSWPRSRDIDPIRDPRTGEGDGSSVLRWITALLFPVLAVLVVLMTWVLHALS